MKVIDNTVQDIIPAMSAKTGQVYVILGTSSVVLRTAHHFLEFGNMMLVEVNPNKRLVHKPKAVLLLEGECK